MKYPLKNILKNFLKHVEDLEIRRSRNDDQYEVEFQQLKQLTDDLKNNPEYSSVHGLKDVNRPKNRYKDIVPYDFCRVIVPEYAGVPGSDYVNASHVRGASGAFAYIAAQGPLPNTVIDFWRMIWVCDVQVIVMACNERECGKAKCESYWPEPSENKQYGLLSVELVSQAQVCPDFLVRTLLVRQEAETREISQFHYTSWPDHGVPERVHPILELVRLVRDCQASETAPILVHCSAGCGRTGTICAIDFVWACLRTGKLKEDFCLYDIVAEMRRQRIAMVQTKEQYMLVHRAVMTMFEQQLRLIDSHTYENLDRDGIPLSWSPKSKDTPVLSSANEKSTSLKDLAEDQCSVASNRLTQTTEESKPVDEFSGQQVLDSCENIVKSNSGKDLDSALEKHSADFKESAVEMNVKSSADDHRIRNSLGGLSLTSPGSAESIPFIDEDDSKSEIQVRARSGRAYLHIPSCDSISKIVDRFDPFVDKVWSEIDVGGSEVKSLANSSSVVTMDQVSVSEASNGASCFGSQRTSRSSFQWVRNQIPEEPVIVGSDSESKSSSVFEKGIVGKIDNEVQEQNSAGAGDRSHQTSKKESPSCSSSVSPTDDCPNDSSIKEHSRSFSRRPSIVKLKGLFDKSRTKNNSKSSLFRHHTHHVSRAGSAPPSLNSMKRNSDNEKESVFAMVSRKFRSSSVKSEQELQKESSSNPTSHLSTLKRTAANSLSTFRQNLSNFSRSIPFGKTSKQAASTRQESLKSPQPLSKGHNKNLSKTDVWKKSATVTCKDEVETISKTSSTFAYPDERDIIQQKFVVNVLSSSPALRNRGQNFSEKPGSPKGKSFMPDFECFKTNPVRLLGKGSTAKCNNGASSLWYSNMEFVEQNISEKTSSFPESSENSDRKMLKLPDSSTSESPKEGTSDVHLFSKIKVSTPSPSSVFYTNVDGKQAPNDQIMPIKVEQHAEEAGNSRFFWPLTSVQESNQKATQMQKEANSQNTALFQCASSHQEMGDGNTEATVKAHDTETEANSSVTKISDSKLSSTKSSNSLHMNHNLVSLDAKHEESVDQNKLPASVEQINKLDQKVIYKESNSANVFDNVLHSLSEPKKEQNLLSEPPALPKKTVVGKKWFDNLSASAFSESKNMPNNISKPVPPPVASSAPVDKGNKLEAPSEKCSKSSTVKQELYINVNDVAKKNIEQIESTLRNHPRGAIIDLTSRQSYSMEQELKDAILKLPEPTKNREPTATRNFPGYEVIWPVKGAANASLGSLDKGQKLDKKDHSGGRPSGICYSPPLRRSAHSSFPVLKSRSCASLDWLHSEQRGTDFQKKNDESKSDSTDTLVNEAVVELSTLLDELTTKTLSDDLNILLDSSKNPKKDEITKVSIDEDVSQFSSLFSSKSGSSNSSITELKTQPPSKSASPHKYETIYLPQKQALSIKHGNEEEIIFHFPPPPPVPPPPIDNVTESFNIICKDGILQLPETKCINVDTSTATAQDNGSNSCSDNSSKGSVPTPIPRKSKHRSSGLRKSASYTTLMTQPASSNEVVNNHSQTLPRLQIASEVDPSLTHSVSPVLSKDKSTSSTADFSSCTSSHASSMALFKHFEVNGNSKASKSSDKNFANINIGYRSRKPSLPDAYFIPAKQYFSNQTDSIGSEKRYPKSKHYPGGIEKSPSDIIDVPQFSRHLSRDQNKYPCMKDTFTNQMCESYTKHSPIYGKVAKGPNGNSVLADMKLPEQGSVGVQVKKSLLPSRKAKPAPHPASLKQIADMNPNESKVVKKLEDVNPSDGKIVKKPASRKTERAPPPPVLQKSNSLRFNTPSSFDSSDLRDSPTYAIVQKHKLPLVFENIPDSHSAVKTSSFRTMGPIESLTTGIKSSQQPHSCSLQHSRSDASVFLALRDEKFLKKPNGSAKPLTANNLKTSSEGSSSSDSDNSYRNISLPNEQMLQKGFLKQRAVLPVAPPRSKRRNTTEIHYMKGASNCTSQSSFCDMFNESMPRVPVKTKEAFEIPEEFKVTAHPVAEKPKSSLTHFTNEELKITMEERMKQERKVYRKQ